MGELDQSQELGEIKEYIYMLLRVPRDGDRTLERLVSGFLSYLTTENYWGEGFYTEEETHQFVVEMLENEMIVDIVGQISFFLVGVTPTGWLPMDGSTYNKADYPELFDVLPSGMKDETAETFTLTDMAGRYIANIGAGDTIGDTVGENEVTLTLDQIPSHNHTESAAVATTPAVAGAGVVPATPSSANTGSAGGGQAHENRPATLLAECYIFAGRE